MSDTREEAQHELAQAGITSDLEDSLGSALESSFSIPHIPKPKKEGESMMAAVASADEANPTTTGPSEETESTQEVIPGMAEWKDTYEGYLSSWHAESAEARKKALETRERIEKEREAEKKAKADEEKQRKSAVIAKEKAEKDAIRLKEELEGKKVSKKVNKGEKEERDAKVKEAWEMVKAAGEGSSSKEVTSDARGVLPEDVAAGQAVPAGEHRAPVRQTAYDPTTSTDPLPPSMSDSPSPSYPAPTESATLSRHSATSGAWEEISGPSSSSPSQGSGSGDDLVKVSHPSRNNLSAQPQQTPPPAPPSLTLSIFTLPGHLTVGRIAAVLGINLVLPFINGVMLGFGEIFAREVVKVGRVWYREGGNLFSMIFGRGRGEASGRSRGVGGVGLSGSGGF